MPYQLPMPAEALPDIVVPHAIPADERVWVPQAENVWFRPLCLNRSAGYWMNLLRVRRSGILSRHRHSSPVHGFVLKGRWRYLEHDWVAGPGAFIYEPAGEAHTLVIAENSPEPALIFFVVEGGLIYLDKAEGGAFGAYEDGFSLLELSRAHYRQADLDVSELDHRIR
jgi:quercetin dioxygenase-like cupin family protein